MHMYVYVYMYTHKHTHIHTHTHTHTGRMGQLVRDKTRRSHQTFSHEPTLPQTAKCVLWFATQAEIISSTPTLYRK